MIFMPEMHVCILLHLMKYLKEKLNIKTDVHNVMIYLLTPFFKGLFP